MPDPAPNEFDYLPSISDLLHRGGVPGVEYLLCLAKNIGRAQKEGWEMTSRLPAITVKGESMLLLSRGDPIDGARAEAWTPRYFVDREADEPTKDHADQKPEARKPGKPSSS
jgi:hypothetical protein